MSKKDVIDPALAKRFAWRAAAPEGFPEVDEEARHEPPPKPPEHEMSSAERERWERVARECAELAKQVERVWAMTPPSRQAAATASLFERAQRMGLNLFGMEAHPLARVRLWRLVVRHLDRLPARRRRSGLHTLGFARPAPEEREIVDLILEVAESGDSWIAFLLENTTLETAARRHPSLGARLARLLDESKTWAVREIAVTWLSYADLREATPALLRALRRPHARIRWIALEILLERAPEALGDADVQWLLDDAVVHPLPPAQGTRAHDTALGYAEALVAAVEKVRPKEGWRPLEIIADDGGAHIHKEREGVDAGWALEALAAGFPERALQRIDRGLAEGRSYRLGPAVEAAGRLPEELARPRLLEAAAGFNHYVAEQAREIWFKRFGGECPADPLSQIPHHLLTEPPGERLRSRLTVLRGSSKEAREAMLVALVGEAPAPLTEGALEDPALTADQREALALLFYVLRQGTPVGQHPPLPRSEDEWAKFLIEGFGTPGFEGLAVLAARDGRAGVAHGWQSALASLARQNLLRPAWRDRVREIAIESLRMTSSEISAAPIEALCHVGAPPEMLDLLWPIATTPVDYKAPNASTMHHAMFMANRAIVTMPNAPGLEARIATEAAEVLAARNWERLEKILDIGCQRKTKEALELVETLLARVDEEPALEEMLARLIHLLHDAGRIDDAWVIGALEHPESIHFDFALSFVGKEPSLAVLGLLQRTLESPARNGAAAAQAARQLVWLKALGAEDRRLDGILERAPLRDRKALLGMLILLEAPLSPFRRHCMDVLIGADANVAAELFEDLYSSRPEGTWELFEAALPLVSDPDLRESIEWFLGEPSEAELFWCDPNDDEEDEFEDLV